MILRSWAYGPEVTRGCAPAGARAMVRGSPRRRPARRAPRPWRRGGPRGHDARMQVTRAAGPQRRRPAASVVAGLVAGLILLAIGAVIVWVLFNPNLLAGLARVGAPAPRHHL